MIGKMVIRTITALSASSINVFSLPIQRLKEICGVGYLKIYFICKMYERG